MFMSEKVDQAVPPERHRVLALLLWLPVFLLKATIFLVVLLVAVVSIFIVYYRVVPAYSASAQIGDLQTTVTLRFFYTLGDEDDGRYLYVTAPSGVTKIALPGFDWAHYSRTSIYLTPDHKIGIVSPLLGEYLLPPNTLKTTIASQPSSDWTYLGAFDFEGGGAERQLQFVSATEQVECIPTGGLDIQNFAFREAARHENCTRLRSSLP